jgi:hypothetical protein
MLCILCPAVAVGSSGCGEPAPAAQTAPPAAELAARVKALEDLLPSQSHMMADVGEHFANLWFAGEAENWPLAEFYLNETRSHLHWAVRRIPVRKDNQGHDIKLAEILTAFENGMLAPLKSSIDGKNKADFQKHYRDSLTGCYSCHKAADKPFLRPQVPVQPASPIVNFDPKATWPL